MRNLSFVLAAWAGLAVAAGAARAQAVGQSATDLILGQPSAPGGQSAGGATTAPSNAPAYAGPNPPWPGASVPTAPSASGGAAPAQALGGGGVGPLVVPDVTASGAGTTQVPVTAAPTTNGTTTIAPTGAPTPTGGAAISPSASSAPPPVVAPSTGASAAATGATGAGASAGGGAGGATTR